MTTTTTNPTKIPTVETNSKSQLPTGQLAFLYRSMLTARVIDRIEEEVTRRGEAFFHVSGAGHEASAVLALHLTADDWLHCHYRDKALMVARGITPRAFFDALYCKDSSHSRGRQMSAHMCDAELHVASLTGPVGNSALHAVGMAMAVKEQASRPIVLCSCGDGTTQEGEFLEACAEAARSQVPVLFFVEDNGWAISTPTNGKTFYALHGEHPDTFHGIPIHRVDGHDAITAWRELGTIVARMRRNRRPEIVVFNVERLSNHTNADDQTIYRDEADIRSSRESGDPIQQLEQQLLRSGWTASELKSIQAEIDAQVAEADEQAAFGPDPEATLTAKAEPRSVAELSQGRSEQTRSAVTASNTESAFTMKDALREVLRHRLANDSRVTLWGEDIEDPKGDVFGVTKGLSTQFPGRVGNSPLTESTIVGVSIGRALAGERPVAMLQFADFLPIAYNQIISELGSMHWRTDGALTAPVIVMVPCGGYRPGLGPFHASSFESVMAHTPGIDVFMPSTAADAAGLLNAAFQSERPTVFFYPKSCLNDPNQTTTVDVTRHVAAIGQSRKVLAGRDITLVAWGNAVRLCERAAESLETVGVEAEIFDLCSLSPWDERGVLASVEKTGRLVVVHEDNHTCGLGAELLATVAEKSHSPVKMRRVTRPDTFVPCNFANQIEVLPSFRRVLETAADLLDFDVTWQKKAATESGVTFVEAIGSGPSDETVDIVDLHVRAGQAIERGDIVASLEATKSVFDLTSPVSGVVEEVLAHDGDTIAVGAPILKIRSEQTSQRPKPLTQEDSGTPTLTRRAVQVRSTIEPKTDVTAPSPMRSAHLVGLSSVSAVTGSRIVPNHELLASVPGDKSSEDVIRVTGIQSRCWAAANEDAVTLGARAVKQTLEREKLLVDDLDLLICTTTTPDAITPSMAYRILRQVTRDADVMLPAYDISAACSGYIYALRSAYDFLQSKPDGRVLVVTTEVLSRMVDVQDIATALVFGDAASATVLYGQAHFRHAAARLHCPELSGKSDIDDTLTVPCAGNGYIHMEGQKVFREAVRAMLTSLNRACEEQHIQVEDLDLIVPHQANQRIIDAVQGRGEVPVYSNIKSFGNTSSSTIPLCLSEILPTAESGQRLGLCAFGGGFTFGAAILETV